VDDPRQLDDEVLTGALQTAMRAGDQERVELLRAEARRRFPKPMMGLGPALMGNT
jgi:hypothetical protein